MHDSSRQALLQFLLIVFAPFRARPAGTAVAPVSLMVYLLPFVHGSLGWPLLQFHSCCSPLSCEACSDGRCSGFANGVLAPFMHGSLGWLLLLSCSCLLLPWFFPNRGCLGAVALV